MAAYRRVYDSHHLQADCQEPGTKYWVLTKSAMQIRQTYNQVINN